MGEDAEGVFGGNTSIDPKKKPAGRNVAGKGDSDDRSFDPLRGVPGRTPPGERKRLDHAARGVHALCKFFQCGLLRALVVIGTLIRARTRCFGEPELGKLGCEHVHRGLGQEIHSLAVD